MPWELQKFTYRQLFGLSAKEFAEEPIQDFFTNMYIYGQIQEKKRIDSKQRG